MNADVPPSVPGDQLSAYQEVGAPREPVTQDAPVFVDWHQRAVRVCKVRDDGFVSFDFIVGDPDIYVEMLLSPEAFVQFCKDQRLVPDYTVHEASQANFPRFDLRDAIRRSAGHERK